MFKRFVLWDYPRAGWQYDVMVGIILAFIFLTPRDWFRDQPRIPKASNIFLLRKENGASKYWVPAGLVAGVSENQIPAAVTPSLQSLGDRRLTVTRVERVLDSEDEPLGYTVFTRP
jgi:hypothetical protein